MQNVKLTCNVHLWSFCWWTLWNGFVIDSSFTALTSVLLQTAGGTFLTVHWNLSAHVFFFSLCQANENQAHPSANSVKFRRSSHFLFAADVWCSCTLISWLFLLQFFCYMYNFCESHLGFVERKWPRLWWSPLWRQTGKFWKFNLRRFKLGFSEGSPKVSFLCNQTWCNWIICKLK